ncbi:MAG: DegT/DnrJ/EryC1/StrS family aminotransferase [Candidatus Sumerlaeia bacterium]|nr:DegT/DnrJ/EryC1/StrS family aminotransferase [Candidatus Sumerlaeia bacterium]
MFYVIFPSADMRTRIMAGLKAVEIMAIFHYVPLHTSPMGRQFGYKPGDLPVTEDLSERLLRLPFYNTITKTEQDYVIEHLRRLIKNN